MLWKFILVVLLGLTGVVAALVYGVARWRFATRRMHARLESARRPMESAIFDSRTLTGLPAPVQRYFRTVLEDGQPVIAAVNVEHAGSFNMSETDEQWKPFTSTQRVVTRRPGFVWDARIRMMPGLTVRVHDAYVAGEGILRATLFGLVSLVNYRGTQEVARGELMRFFAESAWYPTALLPSQGVTWEAVDDSSAKATLTDGDIALTMLFRFDRDGLIAWMRAETRERTVAGRAVPTPWEGRFNRYEVCSGMRVPLEGEVAWVLPEGRKPYWRGRITRLEYQFAR